MRRCPRRGARVGRHRVRQLSALRDLPERQPRGRVRCAVQLQRLHIERRAVARAGARRDDVQQTVAAVLLPDAHRDLLELRPTARRRSRPARPDKDRARPTHTSPRSRRDRRCPAARPRPCRTRSRATRAARAAYATVHRPTHDPRHRHRHFVADVEIRLHGADVQVREERIEPLDDRRDAARLRDHAGEIVRHVPRVLLRIAFHEAGAVGDPCAGRRLRLDRACRTGCASCRSTSAARQPSSCRRAPPQSATPRNRAPRIRACSRRSGCRPKPTTAHSRAGRSPRGCPSPAWRRRRRPAPCCSS